MKVTHAPIPPIHGGLRADGRFQGGSEPPTKTTDGAARSQDTDPAVSIQLSEDAQQNVAPVATDGRPGNSAYSPAHRARAAMETYSANSVLGQSPFGQLVSQIARGEFTEPAGSGDEPAPDGETVAAGDEPAPDGETVVAGDEPAPDGETVATGDEPAPDGETAAAAGAAESLAAAAIVADAAAVEAELIDELLEDLEETTAE